MNREQIIRMAWEAGFAIVDKHILADNENGPEHVICTEAINRFAALVAAAAVRETSAEYRMGWNDGQINEREACVAIAEKQRYALNICLTSYPSQNGTAVEIANAIRARGQA